MITAGHAARLKTCFSIGNTNDAQESLTKRVDTNEFNLCLQSKSCKESDEVLFWWVAKSGGRGRRLS